MARVNCVENRKSPVILLAASLWWPLSARLAIRFLEYGFRVAAICPKGHYLRYIDGIEAYFPYRGLSSVASLEEALRKSKPKIVIPCDDRVVWQLHELHRNRPDLRELIEASLGAASGFELVGRRDQLLDTAHALGILIPTTQQITSEEDIHTWFTHGKTAGVLKLDGTWGGKGVVIVRSEEEAKAAFRDLSRQTGIFAAYKRLLVNRDPLSLWDWKRQTQPSIIMQQRIEGQPANSMLVCWKGEVLSIISVKVLASQGETGAAYLVRVIENEHMTRAAHLLADKLQLSGFYGLDYLIDRMTGLPYLIEVNPRCTQLGHLPLTGGSDLAGVLCTRLSGQTCVNNQGSVQGKVVAFFPQADQWNAKNALSKGIYRDVPQNQPRLVSELMQPIWPERQWISRVYHHFNPSRKTEPVEYSFEVDPHAIPAQEAGSEATGIFTK